MSQVEQVECDKCHQRADAIGRHENGRLMAPEHWKWVDGCDLCPECYRAFREWLGKPKPQVVALEAGDG